MKSLSEFRTALQAMIMGKYTSLDVELVVAQFSNETKRLLIQKESQGWNLRSFSREHQGEMDELSIDFIAALFARDESGIFVVMQNQFGIDLGMDDAQLFSAFQRLVYSHTQQEFIRLFQERDPIGKVLYRSLKYVLTKHPDWIKAKSSNNVYVISAAVFDLEPLEADNLHYLRVGMEKAELSLTARMEYLLDKAITVQKRSFPLNILFEELRVFVQQPLDLSYQDSVNSDTILDETINHHIARTLSHLDITLLEKYERDQKLTLEERQFFIAAISDILVAFANGGVDRSYAAYLNQHSRFEISADEYKSKYKKPFEYVAKTAKKDFSARIKIDFKL